eukprot:1156061-Pelagomonas_calceolata.AAC.4
MQDGAGLISTDLAHLVPYSQEGMKLGSCQSHISNGHSSVLQLTHLKAIATAECMFFVLDFSTLTFVTNM